jgi:hypothetical protein
MEGLGQAEVVLRVKPFRTVRDVKLSFARHFKLTLEELEGPCKAWRISHPRQIAMALAYKRLRKRGYSTTMIGREFGGRDYSTVIYACRKWGLAPDPVASERSLRGWTGRMQSLSRDNEAWRTLGGEMEIAA